MAGASSRDGAGDDDGAGEKARVSTGALVIGADVAAGTLSERKLGGGTAAAGVSRTGATLLDALACSVGAAGLSGAGDVDS